MGRRSRAPPAASFGRLRGVGGSSSRDDRLRVIWPTLHLGPNRQVGPHRSGTPVASINPAALFVKLQTRAGVRAPRLGLLRGARLEASFHAADYLSPVRLQINVSKI